jgi:hypothetical protein
VLPALAAAGGHCGRERRMTGRTARAIGLACYVAGALFLAKAIYRGLDYSRGDIYYTMPGEYARRWNPTLWNSPDMQQAIAFNHGAYLYGPTQYLTLFPAVFFDSYASIASALLVVYPLVLLAAWYALWKLVTQGDEPRPLIGGALFAVVFAFLPVTQAMIQREFEVIALVLFVAACLLLVRGREAASGATLAYLAWFKYWPIILLGAFVVHRRVRGIAAFAVASAIILLVAHRVFGLEHFVIGKTLATITRLVRPLGGGEVLYAVIPEGMQKSDFCRQWIWGRGTEAEMRWALCGLEYRAPLFSAKAAFFALIGVVAALFLWGAYRRQTAPPTFALMKWTTIWEFSILGIVGSTFVHAHYYYYLVFVLPLGALMYWYMTRPQPWRKLKAALLALTYLLLTAFLVPSSWLSALVKIDTWALYLDSGLYALGTVLLLGLVLWEFTTVEVAQQPALAAA